MRPGLILAIMFIGVDVAIGFWDVIAVELRRPRDTVSFIIRDWAQNNLLLVLAVGVILGHLFGPVRQYPMVGDPPSFSAGGSLPAEGQPLRARGLLSMAAYVPLVVVAFLLGWYLLWRHYDANSHAKAVERSRPIGPVTRPERPDTGPGLG